MFSSSGGSSRRLVTQVLSSGTWICPATTTQIDVASGYGSAGSPSSTVLRGTLVDSVTGQLSGSGSNAGQFFWDDFQGDAQSIVGDINSGSTDGDVVGVTYTGYISTNTYAITTTRNTYNNAVPGTAYVSYSAGWKSSGDILAGDSGQSFINYQRVVPGTPGANTTAFGQTFPGGTSGPASTTTFTAIPVTPNTSYTISIPSGGALTISYYQ